MAMTLSDDYATRFGEEFQRHILACCARIPGFLLRYRPVFAEKYFATEVLKATAIGVFSVVDELKTVPKKSTLVETVRSKVDAETFKHVESLIHKMYEEDISDHAAVANLAIDFGKTQAIVCAVLESAELITTGNQSKIREKIEQASAVGQDILEIGLNYAETFAARAANLRDPSERGELISTGLNHLDVMLGGGWGRGELAVILAPPKKGKTTSLINFGFAGLLQNLNVVHITLEMSDKKIARRYDDRLMGRAVKLKRDDRKKYEEEMLRRRPLLRGSLHIRRYQTRQASPSQVRGLLTLLKAQGLPPDLVIVDYADILKAERRMGEMRHEQAGIYEDLRAIAGEFDAAMLTASQTNKNALDKSTVTMADFAESFEKAAIADAVIAFCQTNDERVDKTCRLYGAAVRNAEDGYTVQCEIRRDCCFLRSIGLYDVGNNRVDMGDADEAGDAAKSAEAVKDAVSSVPGNKGTSALAAQMKAEAGIGGPVKKTGASKPTTGPSAPVLGNGKPVTSQGTAVQGPPVRKQGAAGPRQPGPQRKVPPASGK